MSPPSIPPAIGNKTKAQSCFSAQPCWKIAVAMLRAGFELHLQAEERVIFPLAEKWLKTKTLQTLGTEWIAKRKQVLG